jgi:type VI secretion system secreted protein Hcp
MISKKSFRGAALAIVFYMTIVAAPLFAAMDFYLKIEGIKGESEKGIAASSFTYHPVAREVGSGMATGREAGSGQASGQTASAHQPIKMGPRDAASGQPSGKRMHESLTIMKETGKTSPLLMKAQSTGQVFKAVDLEFVRMGKNGQEEIYKTVHLTDAMISGMHTMSGGAGKGEMEEIEFTFQKIEFRSRDGKTMASDDWMASK